MTFGWSSCKKELPEVEEDVPDFYLEGKLNGELITLTAGDDDLYMFPFIEKDSLNILSYSGRLGNFNCVQSEDCKESLTIKLREKRDTQGNRLALKDWVQQNNVSFRGPASYLFQAYKATFTSKSIPSSGYHTYFFGDGIVSHEVNPEHYYINESDSVVKPLLRVEDSFGNLSNIQYPINFKAPCQTDIVVTKIGVVLSFSTHPSTTSNLWDFGNGYLPLGQGNPLPTDSVFKTCVQATQMAPLCVVEKCENVIIDSTLANCVANFDVEKEVVTLKDVRDFGEVSIVWVDENGKHYSSELYVQPPSSFLDIIEVSDYQKSPSGDETLKIKVNFNLRLFGNSETDFITLSSTNSFFAVAY